MGKNELSEARTSMVRDNMANFRRDTRKTRVTGYPGEKACGQVGLLKYIDIICNGTFAKKRFSSQMWKT